MTSDKKQIIDGQLYLPGQEIHNLGSFVCTEVNGNIRSYEGLSKDAPNKLPHYVGTGSSALCYDNGDYWKFHKPTDTWYKL